MGHDFHAKDLEFQFIIPLLHNQPLINAYLEFKALI